MKIKKFVSATAIFLLYFVTFFSGTISAQDSTHFWTNRTAFTMSSQQVRWALFQSSAYGINDCIEISAHPLLFFIMPHAKIKIKIREVNRVYFASEHAFEFPTLFLNSLRNKGAGGFISPQFTIPVMFSFYNGIVLSKPFSEKLLMSAKTGVDFSINRKGLDRNSTIDLPVIFPRMSVYYNQFIINTGFDICGKIYKSLGYYIATDQYFAFRTQQNFFIENNLLFTLTRKDRIRFEFGTKLCYGRYPFGNQWHLLPVINVQFGKKN